MLLMETLVCDQIKLKQLVMNQNTEIFILLYTIWIAFIQSNSVEILQI